MGKPERARDGGYGVTVVGGEGVGDGRQVQGRAMGFEWEYGVVAVSYLWAGALRVLRGKEVNSQGGGEGRYKQLDSRLHTANCLKVDAPYRRIANYLFQNTFF